MAKADVTTWITTLSAGLADATAISRYYDDIVYERSVWLANTATAVGVVGTAVYALPAASTALLAVFWDGEYLHTATKAELEAASVAWRDARGVPTHYVLEEETENAVRLWPTPIAGGTIRWVYGEYRADVPTWLEPAIAWDVLAREFARDSDHRDPSFAGACAQMAAFCYGAVS